MFEQWYEKLVKEIYIYIEFSSTYVVKLVVWTKCRRRASFHKERGEGGLLMEIFDAFV